MSLIGLDLRTSCTSLTKLFRSIKHSSIRWNKTNKLFSTYYCNENEKVVAKDEVVRFISDCLVKVGANREDAHTVGHHLMVADYRGHFSHGMNRMQMYVESMKTNLTDAKAQPTIVQDFQVIKSFVFY